jgi:uncharacterized protein YecE (DUF72 family)
MATWSGRLFPRGTKQPQFLSLYSRVFNTVEGNTTFYALPKADTVLKWRDDVPDDFRFCFKFPKAISHEAVLEDVGSYVDGFFHRLAPLEGKLGTLMLQLPPRFGPKLLDRLSVFLRGLPTNHRYAVELRHPAFFKGGQEQRDATALLEGLGVDTVTMDTRGLHASTNPAVLDVQDKKPNLPIDLRPTGNAPIVRFVPHDDFDAGKAFLEPWLAELPKWIAAGKTPFFFMHAPDDTYAPENAYRFHELLRARVDGAMDLGELPTWSGRLGPK